MYDLDARCRRFRCLFFLRCEGRLRSVFVATPPCWGSPGFTPVALLLLPSSMGGGLLDGG